MRLRWLVLRNILGSRFRSGAIWLCAMLVVGLGLAATLVVRGAEQGLRRNLSRMGADLIVIPWGTMSQDYDGAHLMGMMTARWMPRGYLARISAVEGVEAVSPQLYLATMMDSPYTGGELHLVAFDPASDFVLRPWLAAEPLAGLRLGEVVVGANVAAVEPDGMQVYGYGLRIVRTLQPLSGDVDAAVFMSFETAMALLAHVQQERQPPITVAPETISTAMVKVRLGSDPHEVAVRLLERTPGVLPIESSGLFQAQRGQMIGLIRAVVGLTALIWLLAVAFMGLVYTLAANERRREIATLRALGATERWILRLLLSEGLALALAGGLTGLAVVAALASALAPRLAVATGLPLALPGPASSVGYAVAALALGALCVTLAAWGPATRLSREEPALTMKE